MKAFILERFGSPQHLKLKEVQRPEVKPDQVLVRVYATAINDYDWSMVTGRPMIYRLMFGIIKPRRPIPGMELAGVIAETGEEVTRFKPGDRVFGDISEHGFGSFAEYVVLHPDALRKMPDAMSFSEATAFPHASMLAKQALDIAQVKNGQKVLINGAGGGMGTFALQLLKTKAVHVTGVDTGAKLKDMLELGFDHVLDYKKVDFTRTEERYDVVLDAKSNRAPRSYARALTEHGVYVTVGGTPQRLIQLLLRKRFGKKRLHILGLKVNRDLDDITRLFASGSIRPVLDGPHAFERIPELIQYFGEGLHSGKVVVTIGDQEE